MYSAIHGFIFLAHAFLTYYCIDDVIEEWETLDAPLSPILEKMFKKEYKDEDPHPDTQSRLFISLRCAINT